MDSLGERRAARLREEPNAPEPMAQWVPPDGCRFTRTTRDLLLPESRPICEIALTGAVHKPSYVDEEEESTRTSTSTSTSKSTSTSTRTRTRTSTRC